MLDYGGDQWLWESSVAPSTQTEYIYDVPGKSHTGRSFRDGTYPMRCRRNEETMNYWLTISIPADNDTDAQELAERVIGRAIALAPGARMVQLDGEPPQGATIVGDMHEDAI